MTDQLPLEAQDAIDRVRAKLALVECMLGHCREHWAEGAWMTLQDCQDALKALLPSEEGRP